VLQKAREIWQKQGLGCGHLPVVNREIAQDGPQAEEEEMKPNPNMRRKSVPLDLTSGFMNVIEAYSHEVQDHLRFLAEFEGAVSVQRRNNVGKVLIRFASVCRAIEEHVEAIKAKSLTVVDA
jgi:hypothetical protein